MDYKFRVDFLEEAKEFLDDLDEKARAKIVYNIWKARRINDKDLFKKLQDEIWEFRTLYNKFYYRLFAFWDKSNKEETVVISTHGLIKKTDKIPKGEIEKADIVKLDKDRFNIIKNNKSYTLKVLENNLKLKQLTLEFDSQIYIVDIMDDMDILLKKMGFGDSGKKIITEIKAPMPGLVIEISAKLNQALKSGEKVMVIEAMKMENSLIMPSDAVIKNILVKKGDAVVKGQLLVELDFTNN